MNGGFYVPRGGESGLILSQCEKIAQAQSIPHKVRGAIDEGQHDFSDAFGLETQAVRKETPRLDESDRPASQENSTARKAKMTDKKPHAYIPQDGERRKMAPMAVGLLDYFPAALFAVAEHSYASNEKHNPGQAVHWARGKSSDHADCIARHLVERGGFDNEGRRHSAALAWRALALLQEELEAEGATPGRASKFLDQGPEGAKRELEDDAPLAGIMEDSIG